MSMRMTALSVLAILGFALCPGASSEAGTNAELPDGIYLVLDDPDDTTVDTAMIAQEDYPDEPIKVDRKMLMSAKEIVRAWFSEDREDGLGVIHIKMSPSGGVQLHAATTRYLHRRMAIVIGGVALSAPMITAPVGEETQIEGKFDVAKAKAIAERLTSH